MTSPTTVSEISDWSAIVSFAQRARGMQKMQAQREQMDDYVRSVATTGGAAAEIEKAKGLLDSGAITQSEFDAIKARALAT